MSELLELAEHCEKATGPDRELDRLIFEAAALDAEIKRRSAHSWFCAMDGSSYGFNFPNAPTGEKVEWCGELPRYTASIDAAMALVPAGIAWMIGCAPGEGFFATLSTTDEAIERGNPDINVDNIIAKTPALALCAAAIRAIDGARG